LCKVLQGGTEGTLPADAKREFATVKDVKAAGFGGTLRAGDGISRRRSGGGWGQLTK
jgi:hypothetical protein